MNKVTLIGRLTADPQTRYTTGANQIAIGRYTLAVDRRIKRDGEPTADFINCVVFGKGAEFADKYLQKGIKIGVTGRIQTGSYTDKDGKKVYTTDVIIEEQEFVESKLNAPQADAPKPQTNTADDFMKMPAGMDEELPFN